MPLLEWEGRVLPARRLAEFVPLSDTQFHIKEADIV